MQGKSPIMLSLAIYIHKSQGLNLEMEIIDSGSSETCSGMILVALSFVKNIENILLQYFLYEQLKKVNKANQLSIILSAIQVLNSKFEVTKIRFSNLWNHQ